jgi:hypothetical protein
MSPKQNTAVSPLRARAIAFSIVSAGVTQTGHPGPDTSRIFPGSAARIPLLKSATVCVPQTSISVMRSRYPAISLSSCAAVAGSLNSSDIVLQLFKMADRFKGFPDIQCGYDESSVHDDVVSRSHALHQVEGDHLADAHEINDSLVISLYRRDKTGYG